MEGQQQQQMMMQPGQQQMMMQPGQGQMIMQPAQFQQPGMPQQMEMYMPMDVKLMQLEGVLIKQKFDLIEALSGCERPNIYYVYARHKKDKDKKGKGGKLFKYKEKSTFYERCMTGSCKPFRMKCSNEQKGADDADCMRCDKECRCTYYCFNRADMKCYYTELAENGVGEEHYMGKCYDPWDCMNYSFRIYTESENVDFLVQASCCQCYFYFNCPCEKCQLVIFKIHEGDSTSGEVVGEIRKTGKDCLKQAIMANDADEFSVDFPAKATWKQRAMFMNMTVFVDYTMFEDTSEHQQQR